MKPPIPSTLFALLLFLFTALSTANPIGDSVASEADALVGRIPYVWGGTDLSSGVDCSGLVQSLYGRHGISVPRTAATQATETDYCYTFHDLSQVQLGDTIYFKNSSGHIHHVAIVSGFTPTGQVVITHAKGRRYGLVKEQISNRYISELYNIKRFGDCDNKNKEDRPKDFLTEAYIEVTGFNPETLKLMRLMDGIFSFSDPRCCCNDEILTLFKRDTDYLMSRTYPAIDLMVSALRWQKEFNDSMKKRIKNLKVLNAIYSFSDTNGRAKGGNLPAASSSPGGNRCEPVDLNTEEGQRRFLQTVDAMEHSSSGDPYTAQNPGSSAYGRYQFMAKSGAEYCDKVGGGCCAVWHSGSEAGKACQDKMYLLYTADHAKEMTRDGIPINTCTLYVAHQQGVDGLRYLLGMPNHQSFSQMKERLIKNVGSSYTAQAQAASSQVDIARVFGEYWATKFGGENPLGSTVGAAFSGVDTDSIMQNYDWIDVRKWRREGILLEESGFNFFLKKTVRSLLLYGMIIDMLSNISK